MQAKRLALSVATNSTALQMSTPRLACQTVKLMRYLKNTECFIDAFRLQMYESYIFSLIHQGSSLPACEDFIDMSLTRYCEY